MGISPDDSIEKKGIIDMGLGVRGKNEGGSIVNGTEIRGYGSEPGKDKRVGSETQFEDVSVDLGEFLGRVAKFQEG